MAKKKSIFRRILTFLVAIVILLALAVGALAACVHFEVVQQSEIEEKLQLANEKVGLYKLPLVGANEMFEYFQVPEGVIWPPPPEPEPEPEPAPEPAPAVATAPKPEPVAQAAPAAEPKKSRDVKISRKELEAQIAEREAAEKKRITKLARIYDNMSPEEAAKALDSVNIDTVALILQRMNESNAGQVLAKMNPVQAAQITQIMFDGQQRRL